MDNSNQIPSPQLPNVQTIQTIGTEIEPQQPAVSPPTPSKEKSKRRLLLIIALGLVIIAAGVVGWLVFSNNKSQQNSSTQQSENTSQTSQVTESTEGCAFVPKQNYPENEGLYGIWRENAKKVDFNVYLPCKFHADFNVSELGINGGDDNEVVNVFLRFNRPEPESGEDGLQDDSYFYVRSLPTQHQPPSDCIGPFYITGPNSTDPKTAICEKAGNSKFGPVYKNSDGDLYITIDNTLIIWSFPPYDDSGDIQPMLEIIDSLQKVDPAKLEFFNG